VWLTPHLRDPQPEGERERERDVVSSAIWLVQHLGSVILSD